MHRRPPRANRTDTPVPYTTCFRSKGGQIGMVQCGGEASRFSKIGRSSDIHAQYACDAAGRCAAISRIVESPEVLVHVERSEIAIARADASKHLAAASVDAREVRADLVQQIGRASCRERVGQDV